MKTKEQLQFAVDEIRSVCKKHDVVIFGTCESEDLYGEITISEASAETIIWKDIKSRITNVVEEDYHEYGDPPYSNYTIAGIGDLKE